VIRATPAISDGLLYVRNTDTRDTTLACFDLRAPN
jgi:hypothetical protein